MIKQLFKSKISLMLLKFIVIISGFFTFLSTLVQVYIDYRTDLSTIQRSITQVKDGYSHSIANSLWHLDTEQIKVQIEGILRLRDIEYIKIIERKRGKTSLFIEKGEKNITRKLESRFNLRYGKNTNNIIGEVVIHVNLDHVYERILDRFFIILITQMVKTFLVSFIILFIIYITVAKRIIKIGNYAKRLGHQNIEEELIDTPPNISTVNELDELVLSLNLMRTNLKNYLNNRDEAEEQLREYKTHLEDLVMKRTKQLNDKNELLEQKLREINTMQDQMIAQEKLASLGNLTSGIAHEINNPLNFVINFAQISSHSATELKAKIEKLNQLSQDEKAVLEKELEDISTMTKEITTHGRRAENIIKSMLEHSRSSELSQEKESIDIHEILEENLNFAFHAMRAKYRGFHVNLTKDFDQSIPQLMLSKPDIARVFLNLFSNAFYSLIKKSENKSDDNNDFMPELIVTTEKKNGLVTIKIKDNGLGIDKELIEEVFNPFFTTKPAGEGTGLGLSLSYDIITNIHSGNIAVNSEIDQYCEFIIQLPI